MNRANLLGLNQVMFSLFLILAFITALSSCGGSDSEKQDRINERLKESAKKVQDSISQVEQAEKRKLDSINMENLEKKILEDLEKQNEERKKKSRIMFEYSNEFPMKYQIPNCPFQDERTIPSTPSSNCNLTFYYAEPGAKNWEREIPTFEFVSLLQAPNRPFYGKVGWKYAYSWAGDNSRPIQLRALNEKQVWPID